MDASTFRWPGVPLALASAVLFGLGTPFAKALVGNVSPWLLAGLLYFGSGAGLSLVLVARGRTAFAAEAPLRRSDLPWLVGVVFFGGMAGPVLLMLGLTVSPASDASLLLNLEGVFTLVIAWVVFRENVDLRVGLGAAAILAGAGLLSWPESGRESVGIGAPLIAAACLAWAIDNNLTRRLSASDPVQIAAVKGLSAGAVNTILAIAAGAGFPSPSVMVAAGVVGFFGYGISLALFVTALRHLGAARTGAYFSLAPFAGAAVAVVGFGEPVTPALAAAAGLMGVGLWLHLAERHDHEHVHEPTVHEHRHVHDEHHRHDHPPGVPPGEPHTHVHTHARLVHKHPHYPDLHHRHQH